jgi:hypothetical protein
MSLLMLVETKELRPDQSRLLRMDARRGFHGKLCRTTGTESMVVAIK